MGEKSSPFAIQAEPFTPNPPIQQPYATPIENPRATLLADRFLNCSIVQIGTNTAEIKSIFCEVNQDAQLKTEFQKLVFERFFKLQKPEQISSRNFISNFWVDEEMKNFFTGKADLTSESIVGLILSNELSKNELTRFNQLWSQGDNAYCSSSPLVESLSGYLGSSNQEMRNILLVSGSLLLMGLVAFILRRARPTSLSQISTRSLEEIPIHVVEPNADALNRVAPKAPEARLVLKSLATTQQPPPIPIPKTAASSKTLGRPLPPKLPENPLLKRPKTPEELQQLENDVLGDLHLAPLPPLSGPPTVRDLGDIVEELRRQHAHKPRSSSSTPRLAAPPSGWTPPARYAPDMRAFYQKPDLAKAATSTPSTLSPLRLTQISEPNLQMHEMLYLKWAYTFLLGRQRRLIMIYEAPQQKTPYQIWSLTADIETSAQNLIRIKSLANKEGNAQIHFVVEGLAKFRIDPSTKEIETFPISSLEVFKKMQPIDLNLLESQRLFSIILKMVLENLHAEEAISVPLRTLKLI